jgi:hypothetical protein
MGGIIRDNLIRPDLIFSYWIFLWFILYVFNFTNYSPKFALILGALENIIMGILLLMSNKLKTAFMFVIILTLIKLLPLYYVRNAPIRIKDIYFTLGMFILFIIWLHINNQSILGNINMIYTSLLHGNKNTPLIAFAEYIKTNIKLI